VERWELGGGGGQNIMESFIPIVALFTFILTFIRLYVQVAHNNIEQTF
jgi:hypothetical protein